EEAGGIGAAMAALENPYPFRRDTAVIAEPTNLTPIIACEGSLMKRLTLYGRSAHAATPWEGESVLPHFDAIRDAFDRLAMQRNTEITHPLFEEYPTPWPVNIGTVSAGSWASTVPASLTAEFRIGVAPMESVSEVEAQFDDQLQTVIEDRPWFSEYPPEFERFSVQFEPSEIDSDETIVKAVQNALSDAGLDSYKPVRGATYGTDARHYITADIPTVVFGPGSIEQAHFPNETIQWDEVLQFGNLLTEVSKIYLKSTDSTNAESPLQ
ncbi:MAG: M20/M25/M40 family metallo-hydrolase, partial [Halobacteriaceae archaeon]